MTRHLSALLLGFGLMAGGISPAAVTGEEAAAVKDQTLIEASAEAFVTAFNEKKAEALRALFADDAEFLRLDEMPVEGAEAIQAMFSASFKVNPDAKISLSMDALKFITPDVAFEDGVTISFADGETATTRSRYSVIHVKQKSGWKIKLVRELEEEPLSPYAQLKDLEWLVGDWIDEGADSVVSTSCRWNEKKSFLLRSFEVKTQGDVVLKGVQRIGWDPVLKQVRSWTFDESGGFVEGQWTQVDDRWVIKATGFRAEGESASATQIVTSLGDDRMEWKSEGRLLGTQPLPPMTVILVRKPPAPAAAAASE